MIYFPPEIEGLQTLLLMNPNYVQNQTQTNNLVSLNSTSHFPHTQQLVGIPLSAAPGSQQGLSLTLSSHQYPPPTYNYENIRSGGVSALLFNSNYLKAAQQLLDEVVNVNLQKHQILLSTKPIGESSPAAVWKRNVEPERHEIQIKKGKLINMLDQVEQRYKQYHEQMQIVISTFEQAAGIGTATTYTALALKTISRQFRCLKDAITGQIRACSKSLGEEDSSEGKIGGSRLKFVDTHFRQQRALQQLGMIQHNAWRPQRGLPERSVSVLRAWLFEHFLHPYPKDSDKQILAKQTGLTRSQVSNWFINARVRLWKPMVEEMYLEEVKEQEQSGASEERAIKSPNNEDTASKASTSLSPSAESKAKQDNNVGVVSISTASTTPIAGNQSCFSLIDDMAAASPKRLRSSNEMLQSPTSMSSINMDMNQSDDQRMGYSFLGGHTHSNFMANFGQYPMAEMARFEEADQQQFTPRFSGNSVSLTLGLPHCDNLYLSGAHQGFLPNPNPNMRQIGQLNHEFGAINASTPHSTAAFETLNIQNGKRFAAQLLHDFVA